MPIYTKKGDGGSTKTFKGPISKSDQLAITLGTIDELNSWIGVCRQEIFNLQFTIYNQFSKSKFSNDKLDAELRNIQTNLMTINSVLAGAKAQRLRGSETRWLEKLIDKLTLELPELKNFIYPVGYLQVARAVCRRAEREMVSYLGSEAQRFKGAKLILKYINRLSDALFVLARYHNHQTEIKEEIWTVRPK